MTCGKNKKKEEGPLRINNLTEEVSRVTQSYNDSIKESQEKIESLNSKLDQEGKESTKKLDERNKRIFELELQITDIQNNFEKEKALWNNKFIFLEQQKEQSKTDLKEQQSNIII